MIVMYVMKCRFYFWYTSIRHASFYVINSEEILRSFKLTSSDLPAVFMISNEGEELLRYTGEVLELNLSEWVLRNSAPPMGELTLATAAGMNNNNDHSNDAINVCILRL